MVCSCDISRKGVLCDDEGGEGIYRAGGGGRPAPLCESGLDRARVLLAVVERFGDPADHVNVPSYVVLEKLVLLRSGGEGRQSVAFRELPPT